MNEFQKIIMEMEETIKNYIELLKKEDFDGEKRLFYFKRVFALFEEGLRVSNNKEDLKVSKEEKEKFFGLWVGFLEIVLKEMKLFTEILNKIYGGDTNE